MKSYIWLLSGLMLAALPASAEVTQAEADGFQIDLARTSTLEPADLFERAGTLSDWWSPEHTWSGSSENLYLTKLAPGGLWQEVWADGSVEHGRLIAFVSSDETRLMRFETALGPLQGMGVGAILTITVREDTDFDTPAKSVVTFRYLVTGAEFQDLSALAPAVDGVLSEQIDRLSEAK